MGGVNEKGDTTRTRDPERKQRILSAAADLVARRGYHAVGMAEIGAAAGVTGAAIYRHFESKSAVLVALFDRVIDALLANANEIVSAERAAGERELREKLSLLVRDQVLFAIDDREVVAVYAREIHNLPEQDRRWLRRKQRLYLEEWVHVLAELRTELSDAEIRTAVHAAIGAIQSVLNHESGLAREQQIELITKVANAILSA